MWELVYDELMIDFCRWMVGWNRASEVRKYFAWYSDIWPMGPWGRSMCIKLIT